MDDIVILIFYRLMVFCFIVLIFDDLFFYIKYICSIGLVEIGEVCFYKNYVFIKIIKFVRYICRLRLIVDFLVKFLK